VRLGWMPWTAGSFPEKTKTCRFRIIKLIYVYKCLG
jgi:hypothetical protein